MEKHLKTKTANTWQLMLLAGAPAATGSCRTTNNFDGNGMPADRDGRHGIISHGWADVHYVHFWEQE
jgi:hypothetical protein